MASTTSPTTLSLGKTAMYPEEIPQPRARGADLFTLALLLQVCIAGALTEGDDDEGPCPKCKKTVKLADLAPIGGVDGEPGSAGGESTMGSSCHTRFWRRVRNPLSRAALLSLFCSLLCSFVRPTSAHSSAGLSMQVFEHHSVAAFAQVDTGAAHRSASGVGCSNGSPISPKMEPLKVLDLGSNTPSIMYTLSPGIPRTETGFRP